MNILVKRELIEKANKLLRGATTLDAEKARFILLDILHSNPVESNGIEEKPQAGNNFYYGTYWEDCYFGMSHLEIEKVNFPVKPLDEVYTDSYKECVYVKSDSRENAEIKIRGLFRDYYNEKQQNQTMAATEEKKDLAKLSKAIIEILDMLIEHADGHIVEAGLDPNIFSIALKPRSEELKAELAGKK